MMWVGPRIRVRDGQTNESYAVLKLRVCERGGDELARITGSDVRINTGINHSFYLVFVCRLNAPYKTENSKKKTRFGHEQSLTAAN